MRPGDLRQDDKGLVDGEAAAASPTKAGDQQNADGGVASSSPVECDKSNVASCSSNAGTATAEHNRTDELKNNKSPKRWSL